MNNFHKSVLLQEVIDLLNIKKGKKYIDATLGGGGHAIEIAKRCGYVLGIDVDDEAISYVRAKIKEKKINEKKLILIKGNFIEIQSIAIANGFTNVSGILFDLGVSSHQLDVAERGFSFLKEGPLDMRMDKSLTISAKDLVNGLTADELSELFYKYGEEFNAKRIAREIVKRRKIKKIETTKELADIVLQVIGRKRGDIHPATKIFQALRIAVNDELYALQKALPSAFELLEKKGRLIVISFHSLEDRIVKQFFKELSIKGKAQILTKKPIVPKDDEINLNPRSRSAKLRYIEKIL